MQDELEDLRDCGLSGCRPKVMQPLANIKVSMHRTLYQYLPLCPAVCSTTIDLSRVLERVSNKRQLQLVIKGNFGFEQGLTENNQKTQLGTYTYSRENRGQSPYYN